MSNYTEVPVITYETAARAVELALAEGAKRDLAVCATVVDPFLGLVAYGRADGLTPHSVETSRRKANAGASFRKASADLPAEMATAIPLGTGGLITAIPGGLPVAFDGVHVAGLGVAGGPPPVDAAIAAAVLEQLGADPASS